MDKSEAEGDKVSSQDGDGDEERQQWSNPIEFLLRDDDDETLQWQNQGAKGSKSIVKLPIQEEPICKVLRCNQQQFIRALFLVVTLLKPVMGLWISS